MDARLAELKKTGEAWKCCLTLPRFTAECLIANVHRHVHNIITHPESKLKEFSCIVEGLDYVSME